MENEPKEAPQQPSLEDDEEPDTIPSDLLDWMMERQLLAEEKEKAKRSQ